PCSTPCAHAPSLTAPPSAHAYPLSLHDALPILMWHRKGQFWVQPGGHLEEGEASFEQAARREVTEEIGLEGLERVGAGPAACSRSEEHTSELQSRFDLVCRLLLEKKKVIPESSI